MSTKRLNQLKTEVSKRLQVILDEKGWTMSYFAQLLGKSKSHVSGILNADINLTLRVISEMEEVLDEKLIDVKIGTQKYGVKPMDNGINKLTNYCSNSAQLHSKAYSGSDCIYHKICNGKLGTEKEHIFNSAWGGTEKTPFIVCDKCNNFFSGNLDESFKPFVLRITNTRGLATRRKGDPPPVHLKDGSKLRVHGQLSTKDATHIDSFEAGLKDDFDYDLKLQYRSTAHTCLKALAHYDPSLARAEIFNAVKTFVRNGDGDLRDFAINTIVNDTFLPTRNQFFRGEINHVVLYFSQRLNKVIGVFHLLGVVKRSVILSNEWKNTECVITVGERTEKEIGARFWEFSVIDAGMPSIIEITTEEEDFKAEEKLKFQQWRWALNLSYKLMRHFEKLDKDKTLLNKEEIKKIKKYAMEFWSASLYRTGNDIPEEEIEKAAEKNGLTLLLADYYEKYMSPVFSAKLATIGENVLTSFDPRLKNMS